MRGATADDRRVRASTDRRLRSNLDHVVGPASLDDVGRTLIYIGVIGVIIFIVASAIDARRRKLATAEGAALPGYIVWSVILSLGLGMLSGSIQHFIDFPQYAAALLALGVPVSLVSYMGREKLMVRGPQLVTLVIAVGVFTVALFFGLDWIADEIAPHSH